MTEWLLRTKDELKNHVGFKSQAKSIKVPKDPYEEGKSENEVRKDVNKFLNSLGYISRTIYTGGIPLPGGKLATNPAKGIADRRVVHPNKKQNFWVELKCNSGGTLSPEQQTFKWDEEQSGSIYILVTSAKMLEVKMRELNLI